MTPVDKIKIQQRWAWLKFTPLELISWIHTSFCMEDWHNDLEPTPQSNTKFCTHIYATKVTIPLCSLLFFIIISLPWSPQHAPPKKERRIKKHSFSFTKWLSTAISLQMQMKTPLALLLSIKIMDKGFQEVGDGLQKTWHQNHLNNRWLRLGTVFLKVVLDRILVEKIKGM